MQSWLEGVADPRFSLTNEARPASLAGTVVKDGQPQATRCGWVDPSRCETNPNDYIYVFGSLLTAGPDVDIRPDILAAGALFEETDIISHVDTQKLDM